MYMFIAAILLDDIVTYELQIWLIKNGIGIFFLGRTGCGKFLYVRRNSFSFLT